MNFAPAAPLSFARIGYHQSPAAHLAYHLVQPVFIIGIGTQMVLSPEIERLLLIVVFLPNVVMAWKFGWQGGVLSGLLGSMMITIARQIGVGFSNLLELEIFLATQALLGIGLGIAISRQQHLAQTCTIIASVWKLNWRRVAR